MSRMPRRLLRRLLRPRLGRLPIRLRLALGFTLVMAAVLGLAGLAAELTFAADLDRSVRDSLATRANDLAVVVTHTVPGAGLGALGMALGAAGQGRLAEQAASVAQVLDPGGRVLAATGMGTGTGTGTSLLSSRPLLDAVELARAQHGMVLQDRREVAGLGDRGDAVRLLARPVDLAGAPGGRVVVVVAASLEGHDQALDALRRELLVGGPVLLVLAALAGYGLAAAALRPVEAMRRQAAAISVVSARQPWLGHGLGLGLGHGLGQRLPVPAASAARDELARLGVTLNELLDRVQRAVTHEQEFVADASHELRTPLALLKTELELARRRPRTIEELRRALDSAAEETDRLARLAEDLLLLASADQAGLPLRLVEVDVADLLARVAGRFAARAHGAGRPLQVEVEAPTPVDTRIVADPARLEQAISVLVDNALCHGRGAVRLFAVAHTATPTPTPTARATGTVELHVTDEGDGFPAPLLARAFERFTRGDQARSQAGGAGGDCGGAGLGLAIAQAVAEAHHGSAQAANCDPRGADVWLTLPWHPTG